MRPALLIAYLVVAVLAGAVTVRHVTRLRPRRGEWLDRTDRGFLLCVGVLAGAAWIALAPFWAHGWLRERAPLHLAAVGARLRRLRPSPQPAALPSPEPESHWLYDVCRPISPSTPPSWRGHPQTRSGALS